MFARFVRTWEKWGTYSLEHQTKDELSHASALGF